MQYRYRDDVAIADVAFVAEGKTVGELFENSALALTNTMVSDVNSIGQKAVKTIHVDADNLETLLHRFLQELVFYKDADLLLFSGYKLEIREESGKWLLQADIGGEEIDQAKHQLIADVKAVSFHNFKVVETEEGWRAEVILDV